MVLFEVLVQQCVCSDVEERTQIPICFCISASVIFEVWWQVKESIRIRAGLVSDHFFLQIFLVCLSLKVCLGRATAVIVQLTLDYSIVYLGFRNLMLAHQQSAGCTTQGLYMETV